MYTIWFNNSVVFFLSFISRNLSHPHVDRNDITVSFLLARDFLIGELTSFICPRIATFE